MLEKYLKGLANRSHALPAMKVALVVGTILMLINHGEALFTSSMTNQRWISVALSYLVPYLVSIHGRISSQVPENKIT